MKKTKLLHFYGVALLLLAVSDLFNFLMDILNGEFAMVTSENALVQSVTNGILIFVLALIVVSILVGGYLGIKGILESKKTSKGTAHIAIAKIVGILNCILAGFMLLALFGSENLWDDITTFGLCVVDAVFMFEYAKAAKAVRNGEE